MKTQIPIYRAKKIDSDEYAQGGLTHMNMYNKYYYIVNFNGSHKIDPSTLAIHFPNMIDSEGAKIFASLSKDGKGGDIVSLGYNRITDVIKLNKSLFVYSFDKSKVTGIKK